MRALIWWNNKKKNAKQTIEENEQKRNKSGFVLFDEIFVDDALVSGPAAAA